MSIQPNQVKLRSAGPEDAPGIARVHVLSWQSAYKGLLPDSLLQGMSVEVRTRQWAEWLSQDKLEHFLVAEDPDQGIVGFASGGTLRGEHWDFDCEIAAIYFLPAAQGQGLGRQLFSELKERLKSDGFKNMIVWVLASNSAACGFYERMGGQTSLTKTAVLGRAAEMPLEVDEVGYGWQL